MPHGRLRIYLGVAPGAGTTHALLHEARRRLDRGTDVVIGAIGTRARPGLDRLAAGLEQIGPGDIVPVEELLVRRPAVVLVDDLARANPPGARHPVRWQDVEELLGAGIDVIAALDVRSVASLADVVAQITGERPGQSVPDRLLRDADQLELVDITPQALRRRLAHGGLYPPEEVDAALSRTFAPSALAALRELALAWTAGILPRQHAAWVDQVEPAHDHQAGRAEARERLVVALPGGAGSERLLHRAARLTARMPGAELHAVHVLSGRLRPRGDQPDVGRLRELAHEVGATYQQVIGQDVAAAVLSVAQAEHATQLVIGADPPPGRWARIAPGTQGQR
ncbi:MAG: universal stress protein, partial [Kineosporiaceae bacterium]